jgi:hypothetical protein
MRRRREGEGGVEVVGREGRRQRGKDQCGRLGDNSDRLNKVQGQSTCKAFIVSFIFCSTYN